MNQALRLVNVAGEIADQAHASQVRAGHVEQAVEEYVMWLGLKWLLDRNLDDHNQAILLALAHRNDDTLGARQLYEAYSEIIEATPSSPLTYKRFRHRLTGIILDPFIESIKQDTGEESSGGFEVGLVEEPDVVYTALNHTQYRDMPRDLVPSGRDGFMRARRRRSTG